MKLIIAEKPSVAEAIAHSVGAREKISEGRASCYQGNGYYVANAAGHLYDIGMPENYGYKEWTIDTLPFFPQFEIHEKDDSGKDLRKIITTLMKRDDVDEIICATDAAREGELIFRHIYEANHCTKPVKRLWINSLTDEAIREGMNNLRPSSEYDNMYKAAFTREKCDWYIGMNLSRLYGIADHYAHRIGRVKTPLLAIIAERDNEIKNFVKSTSYKLMLENGAVSREAFSSAAEAEAAAEKCKGHDISVLKADKEEKTENRPELYSLSALQMDANDLLGLSAAQTLEIAQSLYEKKLTTYPRTDSRYISEDMKPMIENIVRTLSQTEDYADRAKELIDNGLNLDKRIVDNSKIGDHHAIIPTEKINLSANLTDNERKVYALIINRLLMGLDKKHRYYEYTYEFWCEDINFDLKAKEIIEQGWKKYRPRYDDDTAETTTEHYEENSIFSSDISIKECVTSPKKHFTDKSLISVMENIDNRIDDKTLKEAVAGKGIGTSATRAGIIEELIKADYIVRSGKQLLVTDFGAAFIDSLPDNVKSVERTAEWEQVFDDIQNKGVSPDTLENDVKTFVKTTVIYEKTSGRTPLPQHNNPHAPSREAVGKCPRCGKNIYEGEKNFYCEGGRECGFSIWKTNRGIKSDITADRAKKLLNNEAVSLKALTKENEEYTADFKLDDTGKYVNLVRQKSERVSIGKCPRCKKDVYEGKLNFYCETGKGCGFTLWKEDKFNGVTVSAKNAADLLSKGKTTITKKTLSGSEKNTYSLVDTGKYINLKKE